MKRFKEYIRNIPLLTFIVSVSLIFNIGNTNIVIIMGLGILLLIVIEVVVLILFKSLLNIKSVYKIRLALLPITLSCLTLHVIIKYIYIDQFFTVFWILLLFVYYFYFVVPFVAKNIGKIKL